MNLEIKSEQHVLVCPLDWGLGHATRCIPLIHFFLQKGKKVSVAGNGKSLDLLKLEFPGLDFFELPGYNISYPKEGHYFLFHMGLQSNKLLAAISKEKKQIEKIINEQDIDLILSDNRFGCYSKKCRTVFLSHQINLVLPRGFGWVNRVNRRMIKKFNQLWIPDYPGQENLSGILSHNIPLKAKYIGPLSRFNRPQKPPEINYDCLAIVSGPEPQRTLFETALRTRMRSSVLKCALVRGVPGKKEKDIDGNLTIWNHLRAQELNELINRSRFLICRSGYSTIMDLHQLNKSAFLVPTPGQTEQEYLGKYLDGRMGFKQLHQKDLEFFELENELCNIFSH